jgi:hypothetical protein
MKLRNQLLIALFLMSSVMVKAQDREFGLLLGGASYQGDLTQKQVTLKETKPGLGLLFRYYFGPRIDIKGGLDYGWISASDQDYSDNKDRSVRNLSFKSSLFELDGTVEFNILPFISNSKRYRFSPYIFGGVAFYHFNPKAEFNGKTYALQPLGTEGQNMTGGGPNNVSPYSLWQFAIPYGVGVKYSLGKFWNIGLEIGQRKLFTDYLDDVSRNFVDANDVKTAAQGSKEAAAYFANPSNNPTTGIGKPFYSPGDGRGDKTHLDMYVFTGITITKTIRRFSCTGF